MTYLLSLIAEGMQKIDTLSGLNNLQVSKLTRGGKQIPEEGLVKQWLRSSDQLTCDVVTNELWLDVILDSPRTSSQ